MSELRGATVANAVSVLDELRRCYTEGKPIPYPVYALALETRVELAAALPAVAVTEVRDDRLREALDAAGVAPR